MTLLRKNIGRLHFIGIGGIGMSGIAEILVRQGFVVSGSDLSTSEVTRHLESLGVMVQNTESPWAKKLACRLSPTSPGSLPETDQP